MHRHTDARYFVFSMLLATALITGCRTAMSKQSDRIQPPRETMAVPLRFVTHAFEAHCYNTISCQVIYNQYDFTPDYANTLTLGPSSPNYRIAWASASYMGIRNFPSPADVHWKSLDGLPHEAKVDIAAIFKDELVWHQIPKADMADFYSGPVAGEPDIFLEVNDHAINVYIKMFIPTRSEQIPGNKDSDFRADLFLAWTQTY